MIELLTNLKLIFFVMFFLLMLIVESYFPKRTWTSRRILRIGFHGLIALINTLIMRLPSLFIIIPALLIINESDYGLLNNLESNFFIKSLIGLLLLDLAFYWWHRINHTISFFWRFHSVHHLDTHLDVTTSLRFHIGELLLSSIFKVSLIFLIGIPISIFIFYEIILSMSNQFHHSNIDLPDKINSTLERFIVTPRYHTNHHTIKKESREANYCSILTIWDKIFFTYKDANDLERTKLGLDDRTKEFGLLKYFKHPLS